MDVLRPPSPERIKQARLEAGLTQVELTARIGGSPILVTRWERGLAKPRGLYLRALKRVLPRAFEDE